MKHHVAYTAIQCYYIEYLLEVCISDLSDFVYARVLIVLGSGAMLV